MLAAANYYFLYQELCLFVYKPVKRLHSAPLRNFFPFLPLVVQLVNCLINHLSQEYTKIKSKALWAPLM